MRITITQDFDSAEAAAEFLARVGNPAQVINVLALPDMPASPAPTTDKPNTFKGRKPRSDAGQPRAPYKPRTTEANAAGAGASTETPPTATSGSGPTGSAPVPPTAPAAAASPTASSAPAGSRKVDEPTTPGAAAEDFPATLEGARKALAALNATAGKGMDACIQALKGAGVNRISDLPKEKYASFIELVLGESSAEGIAAAKKAPAQKAGAK